MLKQYEDYKKLSRASFSLQSKASSLLKEDCGSFVEAVSLPFEASVGALQQGDSECQSNETDSEKSADKMNPTSPTLSLLQKTLIKLESLLENGSPLHLVICLSIADLCMTQNDYGMAFRILSSVFSSQTFLASESAFLSLESIAASRMVAEILFRMNRESLQADTTPKPELLEEQQQQQQQIEALLHSSIHRLGLLSSAQDLPDQSLQCFLLSSKLSRSCYGEISVIHIVDLIHEGDCRILLGQTPEALKLFSYVLSLLKEIETDLYKEFDPLRVVTIGIPELEKKILQPCRPPSKTLFSFASNPLSPSSGPIPSLAGASGHPLVSSPDLVPTSSVCGISPLSSPDQSSPSASTRNDDPERLQTQENASLSNGLSLSDLELLFDKASFIFSAAGHHTEAIDYAERAFHCAVVRFGLMSIESSVKLQVLGDYIEKLYASSSRSSLLDLTNAFQVYLAALRIRLDLSTVDVDCIQLVNRLTNIVFTNRPINRKQIAFLLDELLEKGDATLFLQPEIAYTLANFLLPPQSISSFVGAPVNF